MRGKGLKFKSFWLPLFIFAVAVICFYKVVDKLPAVFATIGSFIGILTPFIVGLIIAFVLYKPVTKMEAWFKKSKKSAISSHARGISVLITYISFFVVLIALLYLILPRIFESIVSLVGNVPKYYKSITDYITELAGPDGKIFGFDITNIGKSTFNLTNILKLFNFDTVMQYLAEIFKATSAIIDLVMGFVISVYMLIDYDRLIKMCGKLLKMVIPERRIIKLYYFLARTSDIFYTYLYSQLLDALIVAVLCFVIFAILGIPYALLLSILMGLCNLIPYFGAIIGGATVAFVTLVTTGDLFKSVIALICLIAAQQLDANIIQPRIVASSLGLRPIYVLLAIVVGGGIFGFFGIILGVPIMAVIRMLILDYMTDMKGKDTPIVRRQKKLGALKKANSKKKHNQSVLEEK